jgi:hypothetical protein
MAVKALQALSEEQTLAAFGGGADRVRIVAALVFVIRGIAAENRSFERCDCLGDVRHAERLRLIGKRRGEQLPVPCVEFQTAQQQILLAGHPEFDRMVAEYRNQRLLLQLTHVRIRPCEHRRIRHVDQAHWTARMQLPGGTQSLPRPSANARACEWQVPQDCVSFRDSRRS